ncbi:MAG TPA: hypothetical protein VKY74_01540, partial [Chloroflexia bacterium]|nr:hypothetical protein [Chloroflexia bacterium]
PDRAPRVLDQIAWRGVILAAQLRATFVPGTPTTQLVVEHQDDRGSDVWRYDLPAAGRTLLWHGHDTIQRDEQSSLGASGQALAFRVQLDSVPALAWVPLAPRLPAGTLPIHSFGNQLVDTWFAPHSAFVVFRVRNPEGLDKGTTEDVWSVPAPPPPGAAPQLLAIARRVYDPTFPTLALPASGALALTIAPDTGLHARTLDGAADRVLAMGVEGVWALTSGR